MPLLRIIYDVDGWAYHGTALALQKYAPGDFDVAIAPLGRPDPTTALGDHPPDVVLLFPRWKAAAIRNELDRRRWPTKLVVSWTSGWPREISGFHPLRQISDGIVINNLEVWERTGRSVGTHLIPNGVDLEIFNLKVPLDRRSARMLWVGSENHRQLKGYDQIMRPVRDALISEGIGCDLLLVDSYGPARRTAKEMADWYNSGTVLVCASRSEGTPNPALEAAACGCTVVATRVGNMPQLIRHGRNGYLVDQDVSAIVVGVKAASANYLELASRMQRDIQAWGWAGRAPRYFDVFRQILRNPARARPRHTDQVSSSASTTPRAVFPPRGIRNT